MTAISAYFRDAPGGAMDRACHHVFENHGGRYIGAGTMLVGAAAGERDVEYDVPKESVEAVQKALAAQGFRLMRQEG